MVICPYVMVPASALAEDGCGTDSTDMHSGLATYLMDDDGLKDCHDLLDDGVLSPRNDNWNTTKRRSII